MANEIIKCGTCPPITSDLSAQVSKPAEIDGKCDELGVSAILANYHLATSVDLSFLNMQLSKGMYIPKQISTREGGRKSQYKLPVGETLMAGIITTEDKLMLRYVTRVSGNGSDAETGDIYREQWKSRSGELIYEGEGNLEILAGKGKGQVDLKQTRSDQYAQNAKSDTKVWVIWSCVLVEDEESGPCG
jgi:hypothetical protein